MTFNSRRVVLGGNLSLRLMSKSDRSGRLVSKEKSNWIAFSKTCVPRFFRCCS